MRIQRHKPAILDRAIRILARLYTLEEILHMCLVRVFTRLQLKRLGFEFLPIFLRYDLPPFAVDHQRSKIPNKSES